MKTKIYLKASFSILIVCFVASGFIAENKTIKISPKENASSLNNIKDTLKCNQLNSKGKKYGLWIEEKGLFKIYYKDGKYNGIYREYSGKGKLGCIGEFKNDVRIGEWYFFDDDDFLIYKLQGFAKNTNIYVSQDKGKKVLIPNKCYCTNYYKNGNIESEGYMLFYDAVEDETTDVGVWKYYDENGKLKETKDVTNK